MVNKKITLKNKLGMHARASSKFVEMAKSFKSEINVSKNGEIVSGKSILGLLMLAAACGEEIEIIAEGPDEKEAMDSLVKLIEERFGENE